MCAWELRVISYFLLHSDKIDVVRRFIAAIELGKTYSGYAFSFQYEPNSIPNSIYTSAWWKGSLLSNKNPTSVLWTKKKEFLAFGYYAELLYAISLDSNTDDEDSEDEMDVLHFFRRFTMAFQNEVNAIWICKICHSFCYSRNFIICFVLLKWNGWTWLFKKPCVCEIFRELKI